jgi:hypothetical protein
MSSHNTQSENTHETCDNNTNTNTNTIDLINQLNLNQYSCTNNDTDLIKVVSDMRSDLLKTLMIIQLIIKDINNIKKKLNNDCSTNTDTKNTNTYSLNDENMHNLNREIDIKLEKIKQDIENETYKIIKNQTNTSNLLNFRYNIAPTLNKQFI